MYLGSHVHFNNRQLLGCVEEAVSYGANTFMFYSGAPTNTIRSNINDELTLAALMLMKEKQMPLDKVICHAPYIINLANQSTPEKKQFNVNFLRGELSRCQQLQVKYLVVHPGNAVGITKEEGLLNAVDTLKAVLSNDYDVTILLETMAGKGTELGTNIDELKNIIEGVNSSKLGICLDTCHLADSGVDLQSFSLYLDEFDQLIGLDKIHCVHLNDSKNSLGSHKDRHENIGFGHLGFTTFINIINEPRLKDVSFILETPYIEEFPPYKYEIKMLKEQSFNPRLKEEIINQIK